MTKRTRDGSNDVRSWLRGGEQEDFTNWSGQFYSRDTAFNSLFKEAEAFNNRERLPLTYWCDCAKSNLSYFGELPKRDKGKPDEESYTLVPIQVDSEDCCVYCGYAAQAKRTADTDPYARHKKFNRNVAGAHCSNMKRIYGIHVDTGNRIEFNSVNAAASAGFASVKHALRRKVVLRGYMWHYEKK